MAQPRVPIIDRAPNCPAGFPADAVVAGDGPVGSYHWESAKQFCGDGLEYQDGGDPNGVIGAVLDGRAHFGTLAIDLALADGDPHTQANQELIEEHADAIETIGSVRLPIALGLVTLNGAETVSTVLAQRVALGQCEEALGELLPGGYEVAEATDGLVAVSSVVKTGSDAIGAIARPEAVDMQGIALHVHPLTDPDAATTFTLFARRAT